MVPVPMLGMPVSAEMANSKALVADTALVRLVFAASIATVLATTARTTARWFRTPSTPQALASSTAVVLRDSAPKNRFLSTTKGASAPF